MTGTENLPPAAIALLGLLQFRDSLGPMYLVQSGYGRHALVAGQLTTGSRPARFRAVNWPTVRALRDRGLVEVDPMGPGVPLEYDGRRRLDSRTGDPIRLTPAVVAHPTPANRRARQEFDR